MKLLFKASAFALLATALVTNATTPTATVPATSSSCSAAPNGATVCPVTTTANLAHQYW